MKQSVYIGESKDSSLFSTRGGPNIKCSDPKFDEMVCLTETDFIEAITCQ